ncbi:MAG: hypothetical protein KatS3mg105_1570 [Gemmatales bacterium]|nr:MAG: hypothetical protein KatS3mg105_1570 [Gemmatales bacterium]
MFSFLVANTFIVIVGGPLGGMDISAQLQGDVSSATSFVSISAPKPRDPVAALLAALGERGVNIDDELKQLNLLIRIRSEPDKARVLYAKIKESLERKLAIAKQARKAEPDNKLIERIRRGRLRILAVTAHPDDENMMSGLLAFARDHGNQVHLLCLTRGEAGETPNSGGLQGDALGKKRSEELRAAVSELGIDYTIAAGFRNGAFKKLYPEQRFWLPSQVIAAWQKSGDPAKVVLDMARRFKADILVTIEPNWGWTGNPEHRAAAELARQAAKKIQGVLVYAVREEAFHTDVFRTDKEQSPRGVSYWTIKIHAASRHQSQYKLPKGIEKHPDKVPHLSTEHYQRVVFDK